MRHEKRREFTCETIQEVKQVYERLGRDEVPLLAYLHFEKDWSTYEPIVRLGLKPCYPVVVVVLQRQIKCRPALMCEEGLIDGDELLIAETSPERLMPIKEIYDRAREVRENLVRCERSPLR